MEKRIELEKRRRRPDQLTELNLDNCRSTTIEGLSDEFVNLRSLSLVGVGLTSLKGFPKLTKLKKLEMSDNRISGGLQALKECVSLTNLSLSNNKIKDLESLEPLRELKSLKNLDLYRNEITQMEDFRDKVFELLPDLMFIENVDRSGKEAEESEDDDEEGVEINGRDGDGKNEEVAGQDHDDDDDDDDVSVGSEDGEEEEDEEASDDGYGLKDIYEKNLDNESEGEDYEEEAEEEDETLLSDDDDGDDAEGTQTVPEPRGTKRPHEEDAAAESD